MKWWIVITTVGVFIGGVSVGLAIAGKIIKSTIKNDDNLTQDSIDVSLPEDT